MNSAILISNETKIILLIKKLLSGVWVDFNGLKKEEVGIFSTSEIERFIEEEELHDIKILTPNTKQSLKSMSSGERKQALLNYLLNQRVKTLILVNPFDNLDAKKVVELKEKLEEIASKTHLVQVLTRASDALTDTEFFYVFHQNELKRLLNKDEFLSKHTTSQEILGEIPEPLHRLDHGLETLISFKNTNVSFNGRQVLQNINLEIKKEEFWQFIGPNGSGKSTLLNMITGDSHKGYGQDLTVFGHKKGSGESVWDIKKLLGYFTPTMVDRFRGYHSVENMLISGLHDSVGLYQKSSAIEQNLSAGWLKILRLENKKDRYFHKLSKGEKRLVMTARAMIKHPSLLILDEPTVGLDDRSAAFFVSLVNKFAAESNTTVLFVSHRKEKGLHPKKVLELIPSENGSIGKIYELN